VDDDAAGNRAVGTDRAGFSCARDLESAGLGVSGGQIETEGRDERARGGDLQEFPPGDGHGSVPTDQSKSITGNDPGRNFPGEAFPFIKYDLTSAMFQE
jgi:hypothetical protein